MMQVKIVFSVWKVGMCGVTVCHHFYLNGHEGTDRNNCFLLCRCWTLAADHVSLVAMTTASQLTTRQLTSVQWWMRTRRRRLWLMTMLLVTYWPSCVVNRKNRKSCFMSRGKSSASYGDMRTWLIISMMTTSTVCVCVCVCVRVCVRNKLGRDRWLDCGYTRCDDITYDRVTKRSNKSTKNSQQLVAMAVQHVINCCMKIVFDVHCRSSFVCRSEGHVTEWVGSPGSFCRSGQPLLSAASHWMFLLRCY